MKLALTIALVLLLTGCVEKNIPVPSVTEAQSEIPQEFSAFGSRAEVCSGRLEKVTERHLRMTCDNGAVFNYISYKYPMTVN